MINIEELDTVVHKRRYGFGDVAPFYVGHSSIETIKLPIMHLAS
jgi:predicted alpha/beta-fold hydrolase